jgi:hypothetical protein
MTVSQTNQPETFTSEILKRIQDTEHCHRFRIRAVAYQAQTGLELVRCIAESRRPGERFPEFGEKTDFKNLLLLEDDITALECAQLVERINDREDSIRIAGHDFPIKGVSSWRAENRFFKNNDIRRAGLIASAEINRFENAYWTNKAVVNYDHPIYFPSIFEVTKYWLSLSNYHAGSDGRNGTIQILLPEERAYISHAKFVSPDQLNIDIAGTLIGQRELAIKGVYWLGGIAHQIHTSVKVISDEKLSLSTKVPARASNLEFCLIDSDSTIYDKHQESLHSPGQLKLDRTDAATPVDERVTRILNACEEGEGSLIEFKTFIYIAKKEPWQINDKDKWEEIAEAVMAFSNAHGGQFLLASRTIASFPASTRR